MSLLKKIIGDLKEKYESENSYKIKVIKLIQEIVGSKPGPDDISLKDGILLIRTNPTIKSAILLKKDQILIKLKENNISVFKIK